LQLDKIKAKTGSQFLQLIYKNHPKLIGTELIVAEINEPFTKPQKLLNKVEKTHGNV